MSTAPENTSQNPKAPSGSFWPNVIGHEKAKAPIAILKDQAVALGQMTRNIVTAEVRYNESPEDGPLLRYSFVLVAPALNNYRLGIFDVLHKPVELYPVVFRSNFLTSPGQRYSEKKALNEAAFKTILKGLLNDQKTIKAIQALMAQSEA